ncbi:MAG: zincin-like metallopeptidase domain-containing protein [Chromatiaceae bacterium]
MVFNAWQIEGLPPLQAKAQDWAETVLKSSCADHHDQPDRAFCGPANDRTHLPARESFKSADPNYAAGLRELGHWTGHPSRLDRDLAHPFGSVSYAKDELRAEIGSPMIGDQLRDAGHSASRSRPRCPDRSCRAPR